MPERPQSGSTSDVMNFVVMHVKGLLWSTIISTGLGKSGDPEDKSY
jgi:hypothetical protein